MCNFSDLIEEKGIQKGLAMGIEQGIEQGLAQGKLNTLLSLVRDGLLSPEEAAKRAGLDVSDLSTLLEAYTNQ